MTAVGIGVSSFHATQEAAAIAEAVQRSSCATGKYGEPESTVDGANSQHP